MSEQDLRQFVFTFIAESHLDAAFFQSAGEEKQNAAFRMAWNMVLAECGMTTIPDRNSAFYLAVAEQTIFLLRKYEELAEGKILTGENVDGISASYTLLSTTGFSPVAMTYLACAKKNAAPAIVRYGRG